jgi:hypothetical protein
VAAAPIALFVYNRPSHLARTVAALKSNSLARESDLHVFSDAPRNEHDAATVRQVRSIIGNIDGFRSVTITSREENFGLARSITDGVSLICERHGRVIVLEDDMVVSPYFLQYMNAALELYEKEERVASIHGYIYPIGADLPETFFIRGADCWGWATWKRAWALYESDGARLLQELKRRRLEQDFDFEGTHSFTKLLKDQVSGRNQSWAIRWHASAFLQNKLTLYPGRSLVLNIGNDESGTHCRKTEQFDGQVSETPISVEKISIQENGNARAEIANFFRCSRPRGMARLRDWIHHW